jgi:hypothetical protein
LEERTLSKNPMKAANLKAFNSGIAMAQADGLKPAACGLRLVACFIRN